MEDTRRRRRRKGGGGWGGRMDDGVVIVRVERFGVWGFAYSGLSDTRLVRSVSHWGLGDGVGQDYDSRGRRVRQEVSCGWHTLGATRVWSLGVYAGKGTSERTSWQGSRYTGLGDGNWSTRTMKTWKEEGVEVFIYVSHFFVCSRFKWVPLMLWMFRSCFKVSLVSWHIDLKKFPYFLIKQNFFFFPE